MRLVEIKDKLPEKLFGVLSAEFDELRPAQTRAIKKGLLEGASLLVCTPTASGKTLVAEVASIKAILESRGKAIYIVPLKALANEKFRDFKRKYGSFCRIALSIGDMDSADTYLADYDLIICTAEKLDSLLRHSAPWLNQVSVVVVDEVHLITDSERGPTLEILITILRRLLPKMQLVALSATIGNPEELAKWLGAELVLDTWRPVKLHQGVYSNGNVKFYL
jgi:helicase